MAGAAPHDKSGRKCSICHTEFKSNSYVGTITRLRPVNYAFEGEDKTRAFRIPYLVCRKCHNNHYANGEE